MKKETGVMVVKGDKAWGCMHYDAQTTYWGWVNPEDATIYNPEFLNKPTDVTYHGSPYTEALSTWKLVSVEKITEVKILFKDA